MHLDGLRDLVRGVPVSWQAIAMQMDHSPMSKEFGPAPSLQIARSAGVSPPVGSRLVIISLSHWPDGKRSKWSLFDFVRVSSHCFIGC